MVAKKQGCHSIAPADKQINEEMVHPTSPKTESIFTTNCNNCSIARIIIYIQVMPSILLLRVVIDSLIVLFIYVFIILNGLEVDFVGNIPKYFSQIISRTKKKLSRHSSIDIHQSCNLLHYKRKLS